MSGLCILIRSCAGGPENRIIARIKLKRPCRPYGTGDILQAWRILPAGRTLYNAVPRCEALSFCSYPAFCENFYGNCRFYDTHAPALSYRGCPPLISQLLYCPDSTGLLPAAGRLLQLGWLSGNRCSEVIHTGIQQSRSACSLSALMWSDDRHA